MWIISSLCLSIIVASCAAALWRYKDYNIAQVVGIALVFFGCFPRLMGIVETRSMLASPAVAEASVFVHVGLAVMALGHAWKLWQHRGQRRDAPRRLFDVLNDHRRAGS